MSSKAPTSVRFDSSLAERMNAFLAAHPESSGSSLVNRLVDEGLRMHEHPGVVFRDGPTGRRAGLIGGPDVAEVIRAVRSARAAEPELASHEVTSLVATNTGVPLRLVRTAIRYWSSYPAEVDGEVSQAERAERAAQEAWRHERELLGESGT